MIEYKPVETMIWDMDGTLLDSYGIYVDIVTQIFPRHGLVVPTPSELERNFFGRLDESLRGLAGDISDDALAALLRDFYAIDNDYIKDVDHHLFIDAIGLSKRGYETGAQQLIVTNRANGVDRGLASPRNMVANSVLRGYIGTVICGDEVDQRKPLPAVLDNFVANGGSYDPETTLVIGDQVVDAEFALNLGARAVLVNRQVNPPAHLERLGDNWQQSVAVVNSLHDVQL